MRLTILGLLLLGLSTNVAAEEIGSTKTSGVLFKTTLSVHAEDDPDYENIVCYTTNIELGGPNLENPTNSSIACRLIGDFSGTPTDKKKIFAKAKSPFFKTLYVDRFYDEQRNVLVYISYTKKLGGKNHSHSVSVVPLGQPLIGTK